MKILHRDTGTVVYKSRHSTLRETVEAANLSGANLYGADLREANLSGANLRGADLSEAYLSGAYLTNTILDPLAMPNGDATTFETMPSRNGSLWCIGYRTANSPHMGGAGYTPGEVYEAPVFSVSDTECHPGIFVLPTVDAALEWDDNIVRVLFRAEECHRAGDKWRVRWLIVVGGVDE